MKLQNVYRAHITWLVPTLDKLVVGCKSMFKQNSVGNAFIKPSLVSLARLTFHGEKKYMVKGL